MIIHAGMKHCPALLRLGIRKHSQLCPRPSFSLWPRAVACPVQKAEQGQSAPSCGYRHSVRSVIYALPNSSQSNLLPLFNAP
jgi:hypothetical protein